MIFTGDKNVFNKCRAVLLVNGYAVNNAIHVGDDVYEFTEEETDVIEKCRSEVYKVKAWVNNHTGKIEFKDELKYRMDIWFN